MPPAPREITDDVDAQIRAAARDIENLISDPSHSDAPKLREAVRGMIEKITVSRHETGAIAISVQGTFAGGMQLRAWSSGVHTMRRSERRKPRMLSHQGL